MAASGWNSCATTSPPGGSTLLNYCGIRTDLLDYVVDRSPHKQWLLLPATRIPVHAPERIAQTRPECVLTLPWNLKGEMVEQMQVITSWGGRFVIPIPTLGNARMRFTPTPIPGAYVVELEGIEARTNSRPVAATPAWYNAACRFNRHRGTSGASTLR